MKCMEYLFISDNFYSCSSRCDLLSFTSGSYQSGAKVESLHCLPSVPSSVLFGFLYLQIYKGTSNRRRQSDGHFCCRRLMLSFFHSSLSPLVAGQQDRRNDLSHPIHADNCLLDPEANECWKEPPAYTFRDYR